MSAECSSTNAIVDSPLPHDSVFADEGADDPRWFIQEKILPTGDWRTYRRRKDQEQAVATSEKEAQELLVEAKKNIHSHSTPTNIAAVELRIAYSPRNEL